MVRATRWQVMHVGTAGTEYVPSKPQDLPGVVTLRPAAALWRSRAMMHCMSEQHIRHDVHQTL